MVSSTVYAVVPQIVCIFTEDSNPPPDTEIPSQPTDDDVPETEIPSPPTDDESPDIQEPKGLSILALLVLFLGTIHFLDLKSQIQMQVVRLVFG